MFDIINKPLGWIIKVCYQLTGNYLIALLIFSIILQLVLSPFGIKQQKNSIKQAKLDPKVRAIRKKYAGRTDQATQQKMNNEIMELYQREKFNPAGGCLPLLIQMPILIALYNVVSSPLKYICGFGKDLINGTITTVGNLITQYIPDARCATQMDAIRHMRDLFENHGVKEIAVELTQNVGDKVETVTEIITEDMLPNFTAFGLDLSFTSSEKFWPLIIIPILTLIFTYGMQYITKKVGYNPNADQPQGASMKIMQWSMPLLSVYIAYTWAATLGCYWIIRNILSIIQTLILAKLMPIPRFTEEDYKAAERELNVKEPKKKSGGGNSTGTKVRSLHRIDEDDEDEAPAVKPTEKKVTVSEDAPKLKDESDRHKKDEKEEKAEEKSDETNEEA